MMEYFDNDYVVNFVLIVIGYFVYISLLHVLHNMANYLLFKNNNCLIYVDFNPKNIGLGANPFMFTYIVYCRFFLYRLLSKLKKTDEKLYYELVYIFNKLHLKEISLIEYISKYNSILQRGSRC